PDGRTSVMYGPGGFAYVYLIYGMHCCMNVVSAPEGRPEAVLIRALEPVEGIELMRARRPKAKTDAALCSGPGKLCAALGIDRRCYGLDLLGGELYLTLGEPLSEERICVSPRVGVDYAGEDAAREWRFFEKDNPNVSGK
nr:DNA-3-methyladenine glycosylase [Oscillospiraceae bacterium]